MKQIKAVTYQAPSNELTGSVPAVGATIENMLNRARFGVAHVDRQQVMVNLIKAQSMMVDLLHKIFRKVFTHVDRYPVVRTCDVPRTVWETKPTRPASKTEVV
ncbi:MAG: hypothetical protein OEU92_14435 [Alphaproteobacteria bacterium]|nr:hypothetical protein [Alphaproteobacteria bacterium]